MALKSLYSSSEKEFTQHPSLLVESDTEQSNEIHFIVKQGMQVVGVATYSEISNQLTDVAIQPSAAAVTIEPSMDGESSESTVAETLISAVKMHCRKRGRSNSLLVSARSAQTKDLFQRLGFVELHENSGQDAGDPVAPWSMLESPL